MAKITFVLAPDIPESERLALEKHWEEARKDPDYSIVTNYPIQVYEVEILPGETLIVTPVSHPDIPADEIPKLRAKVDAAKASQDARPFIVLNYEVQAYVVKA